MSNLSAAKAESILAFTLETAAQIYGPLPEGGGASCHRATRSSGASAVILIARQAVSGLRSRDGNKLVWCQTKGLKAAPGQRATSLGNATTAVDPDSRAHKTGLAPHFSTPRRSCRRRAGSHTAHLLSCLLPPVFMMGILFLTFRLAPGRPPARSL